MEAYEATIRETATENSPWYVVPADTKWFTRLVGCRHHRYFGLDEAGLPESEHSQAVKNSQALRNYCSKRSKPDRIERFPITSGPPGNHRTKVLWTPVLMRP